MTPDENHTFDEIAKAPMLSGALGMFAGLVHEPNNFPAANDSAASDPDATRVKRARPAALATVEEKEALRAVIGPRLVAARKRAGLGQHELAEMLGLQTPAPLNHWEQGRRVPPLTWLIEVADALHVSCDFLLGRSEDDTRDPAENLRHAILAGVRAQIDRVAEITTDQVARHVRLVGADFQTVGGLLAAADKLLDAQAAWQRLNLEAFEDQLGSASVVAACTVLETAVVGVPQKLRLRDALDNDLRLALANLRSAGPKLPGDDDLQ